MSGLFGTFNISKRGINVAQTTIDVTAHNIANANTEGYSRQRAKISASRPMSTVNAMGQIGTGAQVDAIQRVRDTFLDYQIRGESSSLGKNQVRSNFLYEIETAFNEPTENGIATLVGKFYDAFQELSKYPESSNSRTVAAQQTLALTDALNATYKKFVDLKGNAQSELKSEVSQVNSILDQVKDLNKQIAQITTSGQMPNDLLDKRDQLLDELSMNFNITVSEGEFAGTNVKAGDSGKMVYGNLVNSNPNSEGSRLSYISKVERDGDLLVVKYNKRGDTTNEESTQTVKIACSSEKEAIEFQKELESTRVVWANEEGQLVKSDGYPVKNNAVLTKEELMLFQPSEGSMSGNMSIQSDIDNYIDDINKLAKAIALSVNAIHSGTTEVGGEMDKYPLFVNGDTAEYNSERELTNVLDTLYSESEINAGNITINKEILKNVMLIKIKTNDDKYGNTSHNTEDGEGDGSRALAIAKLRDNLMRIQDINGKINSREDLEFLNGSTTELKSDVSGMTVDGYFNDMIGKLGVQAQEADRLVGNQSIMVSELLNSRSAVSGVSVDEEVANLVAFQHAYSANAKVISTIDELLDVIINGLKR